MKFSSALAGFLAATALAAPTAEEIEESELARRETYTSTACIDPKDGFHVVSAGGEYTTVGNLSLLNELAVQVLAIAPGSQMYQIPYVQDAPASQDIANAMPLFIQHIENYVAQCPQTKIVTLGYSVGATIVMNAFCGDPRTPQTFSAINPKYHTNILANIIYGDLTFVSGERSSKGTCTSGQGVVPRTYPGQCYPFGRKTQSYCDVDDPQCCDPGSGNPEVHFSYPGIYDNEATQFVKAKWNYYKKHNK